MVEKMSRLINNILNDEFEKSTTHLILKDISKISLDYVPESLPQRENELSNLVYIFKDLVNRFNGPDYDSLTVLILGNKKTGKTVTIKRFGLDLEKYIKNKGFQSKIHFAYRHVNCIRYRTVYSIFISVIQSFVPEFPIRGFSTFELIKYLKEYLEVSNSYLLLTLDDIDALNTDKDYEIILGSLVNSEVENFEIFKKRISIILISSNNHYLKTIKEPYKNYLKQNVLYFDPYTHNQIFQILKSRVEETLNENTWTDNDIAQIIELVENQNNGYCDTRMCLEILWRAARLSEQNHDSKLNLELSDISEVIPIEQSKIDLNLKIQEKVLLYVIAQIFLKNPNLNFTKIKEIKKEFDSLKSDLDISFTTLGYTSIFNYLQELKKLNLIVSQVTNSQKRGRSTIIKLNIQPSHVDVLLRNQLLK